MLKVLEKKIPVFWLPIKVKIQPHWSRTLESGVGVRLVM